MPITRVAGDLNASGHLLINTTSSSIFANNTLESAHTFDNGRFHIQHIGFWSLPDKSEDRNSSGIIDTERISRADNHSMFNAVVGDHVGQVRSNY
jgi:hypothetical protein